MATYNEQLLYVAFMENELKKTFLHDVSGKELYKNNVEFLNGEAGRMVIPGVSDTSLSNAFNQLRKPSKLRLGENPSAFFSNRKNTSLQPNQEHVLNQDKESTPKLSK